MNSAVGMKRTDDNKFVVTVSGKPVGKTFDSQIEACEFMEEVLYGKMQNEDKK